MTETRSSTYDDSKVSDDDWADALSEQAEAGPTNDHTEADEAEVPAGRSDAGSASDANAPRHTEADADTEAARTARAERQVFRPLEADDDGSAPRELDMIMDIPVTLSVELGQTRLTIRDLLDLAKGSIVELDGLAGEPMDILINGYLIAQGEVVVVEDKYGIRITEIITRSERINKLNG